jgi:hypothetical protein
MTASKATPGSSLPCSPTSGVPARCSRTVGWNQPSTPRSAKRCLIHQATSRAVVRPTVRTAGDQASSTTSCTSWFIARSAAISSGSRVSSQPTASVSAGTTRSACGPSAAISSRCSVTDSPSAWANTGETSTPIVAGAAWSTKRRSAAHWDSSADSPGVSPGSHAGRNCPTG